MIFCCMATLIESESDMATAIKLAIVLTDAATRGRLLEATYRLTAIADIEPA